MKTKRLFLILLSLVLAATLSVFAFACTTQEQTVLTIDSKTEATIEIGEEYTLVYTCAGTVTVTVSGGNYDETTRKFSAEEAGVYTLTVVGVEEGKTEATATVTVTVKEAADKTVLQEAIKKTTGLIASDYTDASWATLSRAKANANSILNSTGKPQADVDDAAAELEEAIKKLVPAAIDKIDLNLEGKIVFEDETYFAEDYENFDEIKQLLADLNADTTVKLNSVYQAKAAEILEGLEVNVLNITVLNAPEGKMLLSELTSYTMTAEVADGVNVSWKLNGTQVATGATYTYTPAAFGEQFEIAAIAEKDGKTNTKTFSGEIVEAYYSVNKDGIVVENDIIKVTESFEWGNQQEEGLKVTLPDLVLTGDFTVYFDLKFTEARNAPNVMALFLLNANTVKSVQNWIAIRQQDNKLEVAFNANDKPTVDMVHDSVAIGNTMHFRFTRKIEDGKAYLTAALLDDNGREITVHNNTNKTSTYTGDVVLGINAEHASFEVSNISLDNGATIVLNKSALHREIVAASGLISGDYTEESFEAFSAALGAANTVYNAKNKTQDEIDEATAAIKAAFAQLVKATVVTATTTENSFTYKGVTYPATDYKNLTGADGILAKVNALNESVNADMTVSQYDALIKALIEQLIPSLEISVTGAPDGKLIVNNLVSYTLTASTENAEVTWTLNGQPVTAGVSADGLTYTFTPAAFDTEYTIVATATRAGSDITPATKTFVCSFVEAGYKVHQNYTGTITVADNTINVNGNDIQWDSEKGKKLILDNFNLYGEFSVSFDARVTSTVNADSNFGLFLLDQNGNLSDGTFVIVKPDGRKLAIKAGTGGEQRVDFDGAVDSKNLHVRISRVHENGAWYLVGEILDGNGKVLTSRSEAGCPDYNVVLGLQIEKLICSVSNLKLIGGTVIDRQSIVEAKENCDNIDKTIDVVNASFLTTNFAGADVIKAYKDARQEVYDAYYTPNSSPERIATAISEFDAAYTALLAAKIDPATVKAEITSDETAFTYGGKTYDKNYYTNIKDVIAEIKALEANTYEFVTQYQSDMKTILAKLVLALEVGVTAEDSEGNAVANNSVIIDWAESYTLTASGNIAEAEESDFSYAWKVDGKAVATTKTYTYTPAQGTHVIEASVTYGSGEAQMTVSKTFTLVFEKANVNVHTSGMTNNNDGTFTAATGIGWGDWEGRKVEFDELVFNGSFSTQMDITFNSKVGGANVVTIHFLNADTISRDSTRDNAVVGYGCICLHENPVRLETGGNFGKKQSSDEGFEAVATALSAAQSQYAEGKTFTVKLDVYRTAAEKISYDFSVYDEVNGEWITFARENEWGGNFGGGFIVGINIENAGVTLSNVKFGLLEEGTRGGVEYLAGSVLSKADLYNKYVEYASVDASDYVNGGEFLNAYYAAFTALCNNKTTADYATALENLEAAHSALVEREVDVTVAGLDSGYNEFRGYDKFTAVLPEDATGVQWTYGYLSTEAEEDAVPAAKTVNGAELALTAGVYSNVKLTFTSNGETYTYTYQDFTVTDITLWGVNDKVTINDDGTVNMEGIAWDNPLEQLVLKGVRPHEFELSVDVTYGGGGVIAFRLGGRDVQMVVRFSHEGKSQIGFDEFKNNGGYVDVAGGFTVGQTYTFKITAEKNERCEYVITFSAYNLAGDLLATKTRNETYGRHFDDRATSTEFNITDENVTCTFSNFKVMYN